MGACSEDWCPHSGWCLKWELVLTLNSELVLNARIGVVDKLVPMFYMWVLVEMSSFRLVHEVGVGSTFQLVLVKHLNVIFIDIRKTLCGFFPFEFPCINIICTVYDLM